MTPGCNRIYRQDKVRNQTAGSRRLRISMKDFARFVCLYCGLCNGLVLAESGHLAAAQQAAPKAPGNERADSASYSKVSLASNSGPPGTVVVLPLYFTPAKGREAGRLKAEVSFPSASLKFEKIAPGVAAKKANLEVTSSTRAGKNDKGEETTALVIEASLPLSAKSGKGIPAGMLAAITLRIPDKAKPSSVNLHMTVEGTQIGSGAALSDLHVSDAKVTIVWVDAPPSISCFFFSH